MSGPSIRLDDQGISAGHFDVHDYIGVCEAHYEKMGFGADVMKGLMR